MADAMNIFTYGSLMFAPVWSQVVRGSCRSTTATIHGFRRLCVLEGNYPALVIAPRATALVGRLYLDVSGADVARLDYFETREYERVSIAATVDGDAVIAEAYLAVNVATLTSKDWSVTRFEDSGLSVFLETYVVKNSPSD